MTSLAVLHSYRRNGVALGLMDALHNQMSLCHGAGRAQLHVRCSNEAALRLYASTLRYKVAERISRYYHDGEDAFLMALDLDSSTRRRSTPRATTGLHTRTVVAGLLVAPPAPSPSAG